MTVSVSPEVLKVIAEAEAKRAASAGVVSDSPDVTKKVSDSIVSIFLLQCITRRHSNVYISQRQASDSSTLHEISRCRGLLLFT